MTAQALEAPPAPAWVRGLDRCNLIVQFDCAEAILFEGTEEEALELRDDLDCAPKLIIPVEQVTISSVWTKNGWARVDYRMKDP